MSEFRSCHRGLLAAIALIAPALAGCSSSALPSMPSVSSWFGSNPASDANASAVNTLPMNFECPVVNVRTGASTMTSSSDPADPSATNLRYQVGFANTARECRLVGNNLSIKVGMQGRVILGPQGSPGTVDVPIRYAVIREGVTPTTVTTRLERISVNMPPGDTNVLFSHVVDALEFPMPRGAEIDSYVVYIGFDPVAAQEMDRRRPAPKPARPRKPAVHG